MQFKNAKSLQNGDEVLFKNDFGFWTEGKVIGTPERLNKAGVHDARGTDLYVQVVSGSGIFHTCHHHFLK